MDQLQIPPPAYADGGTVTLRECHLLRAVEDRRALASRVDGLTGGSARDLLVHCESPSRVD